MTSNSADVLQDESLIELIEALESIDLNTPEAELNAVSISDNNGGRILL